MVHLDASSDTPRTARYRENERRFWASYGLEPVDRIVRAGRPPVELHVSDVGEGEPVVFVHGTGGPGAYFAPLIQHLGAMRSIVLDRPGWGRSEPFDYTSQPYAVATTTLLRDTLDALGIQRCHLVSASIGDLWTLRFALAHPDRAGKIALLGGGRASSDFGVPPFIKLLRSPMGNVIIRLPEKPAMLRKQLAKIGHGASLATGQIPDSYVAWHVAMSRNSDWGRNERDMVRAIIKRDGLVDGLVPSDEEIASVEHPVLMVFGTADPFGSVGTWRRLTDRLPNGRLELIEGGGHVIWLDDPERVGRLLRDFLAG
jgi:pimeloyl-ACP methyl ester carboxylesterase